MDLAVGTGIRGSLELAGFGRASEEPWIIPIADSRESVEAYGRGRARSGRTNWSFKNSD
jgi:hypothetical protein